MKKLRGPATTLLELAGAGAIVAGIAAFSRPIALIVAGILAIAAGFLLS